MQKGLYGFREIEKVYSDFVSEYLADGYTINTQHPTSVLNGGITAITLFYDKEDSKKVVAVTISRDSRTKKYSVKIEKHFDDLLYITLNSNNRMFGVSKDNIEQIKRITFYPIDTEKELFTDSVELINEITAKREAREKYAIILKTRVTKINVTDKQKRVLLKLVKQRKGYKRTKLEHIRCLWAVTPTDKKYGSKNYYIDLVDGKTLKV